MNYIDWANALDGRDVIDVLEKEEFAKMRKDGICCSYVGLEENLYVFGAIVGFFPIDSDHLKVKIDSLYALHPTNCSCGCTLNVFRITDSFDGIAKWGVSVNKSSKEFLLLDKRSSKFGYSYCYGVTWLI